MFAEEYGCIFRAVALFFQGVGGGGRGEKAIV